MLAFCKEQYQLSRYQHYKKTFDLSPLLDPEPGFDYEDYMCGEPQIEFYVLDKQGRRGVYPCGQTVEFYQAGYEMPTILYEIMVQTNRDFCVTGTDTLNHAMISVEYNHCPWR